MLLTRIVAAVLAFLSVVPLWRMLPQRATGLAGMATAEAAAAQAAFLWSGLLVALIPALIAARILDPVRLESTLARIAAPLTRPAARSFAIMVAVLATLLAALVARIMAGPTLIDSFAQLLQARYWADGVMAAPALPAQPFWHIQQTLVTGGVWISQYPPGYIALLAAGFTVRSVWLVGPIMLGVAVFFTALIADDVFQSRPLARAAALLAALSPFMLTQAGAYMSHVPAAAFSAGALYFLMRGSAGSAVAAGLCIGALFAVRPLSGLVSAIVALVCAHKYWRNIGLAITGAAPILALVAAYNARFFGSPFTFGYDVALGPNAGLGFGTDPWGNGYGIAEALAYTSAELMALNVFLFETPLPLVLFVGLYFATARAGTLPRSQVLVFCWATALVIANMFYWHHGLHVGPRMLADNGPLWVLLVVMSVAGLIARIRADWNIADRYSVRAFATGGVLAALVAGLFILAPQRIASYAPSPGVASLLRAPAVENPALVFVHGGWTARIGARLAARGMRLDSVETALRQNSTCAAHHFSLDYEAGRKSSVRLDFNARPVSIRSVEISPGNRIRALADETFDAVCAREVASDTAGVMDVTPFVWQADLPGRAMRGALFARDLGPQANAQLIAVHPERTPLALTLDGNGAQQLVPYDVAMQRLWGTP